MKFSTVICFFGLFLLKALSVEVLTSVEFYEKVGKNDDVWLIEFYAPWCGHCKRFMNTFDEIGEELKGKVRVAKIDATSEVSIASVFQVQSFPTFFHINGKEVRKYKGRRKKESLIDFSLEGFKTEKTTSSFASPFGPFGRVLSFFLGFVQVFMSLQQYLMSAGVDAVFSFAIVFGGMLVLMALTVVFVLSSCLKYFEARAMRSSLIRQYEGEEHPHEE